MFSIQLGFSAKLTLFPLLFMLLLCSCGDTIAESNADDLVKKGSVSVIISDAFTGLPVTNAEVLLLGRDANARSAKNSGILYEDLPTGKGYVFHIKAPNYASMKCKADVYPDSIVNSNLEVRLPKLGAKLQGTLAYADMATNAINYQYVGYGEAKVRLKLRTSNECELLDPYRETSAGLNDVVYGQFSVQNEGILGFSGEMANAPLGIYKYAVSQEEFRLLSAPDTVAPNEKISLVFSKDINKSRTKINAFYITGVSYALDIKWNDGRTLEISPTGGIWKVNDALIIANTDSLYAADGTILAPGILITVRVTDGALKTVPKFWVENVNTGTVLNAMGDSLDLAAFSTQGQGLVFRWNKATGATSYVVYAKCTDEINYTQITSLSFTADTSATWSYSQVSGCIKQNKQSSFFVQAKNARESTNSNFISITGYVKEAEQGE